VEIRFPGAEDQISWCYARKMGMRVGGFDVLISKYSLKRTLSGMGYRMGYRMGVVVDSSIRYLDIYMDARDRYIR
jgi:hypothetical protein